MHCRRRLIVFTLLICVTLLAVMPSVDTAQAQATRRSLPTNTRRASTDGTPAPVIVLPLEARLCADCTRVRLRSTPGTAGAILTVLKPDARFGIFGRSDDALWLEIALPDGLRGWVSADFVRQLNQRPFSSATINALPVNGVSMEASATPTSALGIPSFLSGVTSRTRSLFLKGREMGNRANVFVRVGDSITVSPNFLIDIGVGKFELGAYGSLGAVIEFYRGGEVRGANSFTVTPIAAGAGWTTESLLTPGFAYKEACNFEAPLICEYKLSKPAVALILIGTNDSGSGSADAYGNNLRTIVQTSLDMGVIPVLSTLPPKRIDEEQSRRVDLYNRVIRQVALQYEIPLWDFFYAMDRLPNGGMSADGLHPSVPPDGRVYRFSAENLNYGYTLRNLQALQALDTIWRLAMF